MTVPTDIIDSSLSPVNKDIYYVIEKDAIWRTSNLSATGTATWEKVYDAATQYSGGTWVQFCRIIAANSPGVAYAIGVAQKSGQTGDNYTAYCFKTSDLGESWAMYEITGFENAAITRYSYSGGVSVHEEHSTEPGFPKNSERPLRSGGNCTYAPGENGEYAAIKAANGSDAWVVYDLGGEVTNGAIDVYWDKEGNIKIEVSPDASNWTIVYGPANIGWATPCQLDNINFGSSITYRYIKFYVHEAQLIGDVIRLAYWSWLDSRIRVTGFDVARTNINWLYVGIPGVGVVQSVDGGSTWSVWWNEDVIDILVDPLLAGAIYVITMTEALKVHTGEGQTETLDLGDPTVPYFAWNRIARSLHSGRVWYVFNGSELKKKDVAAISTIFSGKVGMRGMHSYSGDKLSLCGGGREIWISDDGTTFLNKVGNWSEYRSGIQAHRIV